MKHKLRLGWKNKFNLVCTNTALQARISRNAFVLFGNISVSEKL